MKIETTLHRTAASAITDVATELEIDTERDSFYSMDESVSTSTRSRGRPCVVIVGAGFGGLSAAKELAGQEVDVLVVDRNNYHGFWPLLYQVATAGLEPEAIAYPVRGILRSYPNVDFQMAEVTGVDFARRQVLTDGEPIAYDYLVLAAGSTNNYFGNDSLAQQTYGLKDLDDAEALRNHVLRVFERAAHEHDTEKRAALLTFVIVGGGPTGVELAGAFMELIRQVMQKDYPSLDLNLARVLLVESHKQLLKPFPKSLQQAAYKRLVKMGVEIEFGRSVADVQDDRVVFRDGTTLQACTVVWAAGVRAAHLTDALNVSHGHAARVRIAPTLNLPEHPEVFVVGDMAYLEGFHGDQPYPMVAQVAIQMGQQAAHNIVADVCEQPLQEFHYVDLGQMATIGRKSAVFDAFGVKMSGFIAWVGWLFIHLLYLIGSRNRLVVLTNWIYNYCTYDRGVRLITPHNADT